MQTEYHTREDLIAALATAVPAGRDDLSDQDLAALTGPTACLLAMAGELEQAELHRFQELKTRALHVDAEALRRSHVGKTVVVTGGTGCIGSTLLAELVPLSPARLISLSRGVAEVWSVVPGVDYLYADIRDAHRIHELFQALRPDIVYHLAAQHDPGLAEIEVARTLSTNITGSANVMEACRRHGAKIIHASTGKALRPLSRDIYAASKKAAEWLLAYTMRTGELVGAAARFTHVVDNSIIAERLQDWTETGSPVRLHGPDVSFYLQSALEAAQLLMCVGLDAKPATLNLGAIRDLGWPISLMDLAVGWLASIAEPPPLYICGFEAGYEFAQYPGLYDPQSSGDRSPLFNALEAPDVADSVYSEDVDLCRIRLQDDPWTRTLLERLEHAAAGNAEPATLRARIEECGWAMWSNTVAALPSSVLDRHIDLTRPIPQSRFSCDDKEVINVVRSELGRRGPSRELRLGTFRRSGGIGDRALTSVGRDAATSSDRLVKFAGLESRAEGDPRMLTAFGEPIAHSSSGSEHRPVHNMRNFAGEAGELSA